MEKVIVINRKRNIRDIAYLVGADGRHIKKGCLVRGGQLNDIAPRDKRVLESFHFDNVFDFRDPQEIKSRPDQRLASATYHKMSPLSLERPALASSKRASNEDNLLCMLTGKVDGSKYMKRFYRALIEKESTRLAYRGFFRIIMEKPASKAYWHCSQGKDRAGLAAFFLEYALGVSLKDCLFDYLYSAVAMNIRKRELEPYAFLKAPFGKKKEAVGIVEDLFSVREDYIGEALKAIDESFGGLDAYLENELKVDVEKLRKSYLV